MIAYNTAIVLLGTSLLGASAGLVGSYAVLRGRSLLGDALAHAALPGLCLAFLLVGERSLPAMLAGALVSGVVGVAVITVLRRYTRIKEDAAIGIVLSVFFGAGVALSGWIQRQTTTGSKAGLDTFILGRTAGMIRQDLYLIAAVALVSLLVVLLLYKEFKLVSFDVGFAGAQGWPALKLDLLMMVLLAVTVVIGLPAVGVVLMAAMLILPAAAARFWTDRLSAMLALSALFGLVAGAVGTSISANRGNMPAGPVIVLSGTVVFLISVLFAARRGGLARLLRRIRFRRRLGEQILLELLYELAEPQRQGQSFSVDDVAAAARWDARQARRLLDSATRRGLVETQGEGQYRLSEKGASRAAEVARGSRLWTLFLLENAQLAGAFEELDVESADEVLPPQVIADLEAKLQAAGRLPARWRSDTAGGTP
ncbi:MAG: iron chelate uptake ABC transporter family permease subunit [Pirellulales bacterium]